MAKFMKDGYLQERIGSPDSRVAVFNEMDSLRDLVIWGEPGCETVLGQLLPENVSLFWKKFDVIKARNEFTHMQSMFEGHGIRVIRMKDVIADNPEKIVGMPTTIAELSWVINKRGQEFYNYYKNHPEYKDNYKGNLSVLRWVDRILAEDQALYGTEKAIALNWTLCFPQESQGLPMADIMYARDQSNALGDKIVMSRMRWDIRQPEVSLFRKAYQILGFGNHFLELSKGYVEGGDAYIIGDSCLIGAGVRTSREAIKEIYEGIKGSLDARGIEMFAVVNQELIDKNPQTPGEEMDAMHLDTFMMPIDTKTVLACGDEIDKRHVEKVDIKGGAVVFTKVCSLREFLGFKGIRIVNITPKEQKLYSTNFLHLGAKKVIVPLEDYRHKHVNQELRTNGLNVQAANIKELVGGYGAVHCMTAAIRRG